MIIINVCALGCLDVKTYQAAWLGLFFSLASVIERQRHGKKAEQWMSCQERPGELQLPVRVVVCLVLLDNTIVQLSKLICKIQPKNNHHLITAEHLTAELLVVSCQQWPIDSRSVCMCLLKIYYNSILQALALVRSDCWGPLGPGPDLGPLGLSACRGLGQVEFIQDTFTAETRIHSLAIHCHLLFHEGTITSRNKVHVSNA